LVKYLAFLFGMLCAGCSGNNSGAASQGNADAWPTHWCQAQPGMSKDALVQLMGPPSTVLPEEVTWSNDHYQFYAYLHPDGSVRQLDINSIHMTAAEKAGMQCKTGRSKGSIAEAAAPRAVHRPACELVPAATMSAILGAAVVSEASGNPAGGQSKCVYTSSAEHGPYVELSVDIGDGESGMAGAGFAGVGQKGMVTPYDGIGDQAVSVGPALFIRTGDDLVTIVLSGVSDSPARARKIFATAKAGM
jgi:hypothetical protein